VGLRPDFKPPPSALTGSRVVGPDFVLPLVPAREVTGVVRDVATRKPLAGISIRGQADLRDSPVYGYLVLPDVRAVTDAEGKYVLDGLHLGKKYVLLADPPPGAGPLHRFAACKDEALGAGPLRVDFDLPRGVVLTGKIKDRVTGKPVFGHVFYRPLWSNKWVEGHPDYVFLGIAPWYNDAEAWTEDGRFKLTVPPGPGILHAHALEGEYLHARLAAEDDNEEVLMENFDSSKVFRTSGQGGHFRPSHFNAYRVLRIPADARAFTADLTVDPGREKRK
jgi:hypothetical protein